MDMEFLEYILAKDKALIELNNPDLDMGISRKRLIELIIIYLD